MINVAMNYTGDFTIETHDYLSTMIPLNTTHNTRVLFVEHDPQDHEAIKNLLLNYSYKVTAVMLASTASAILLSGKEQFDLVLANMTSPDDVTGFQLLQDAIQKGVLVILMSNNADHMANMRALGRGAFLCIEKSVAMQIMKYLWVHFARGKDNALEPIAIHNRSDENHRVEANQNETQSQIVEGKRSSPEISKDDHVKLKKKVWTRWTKELHEKFVDAVTQLGDGRCFPNEILRVMNVPGLTRMQVASHLQICRNTIWLPPNEKHARAARKPLNNKVPRGKPKKIGAMPHLDLAMHKYDDGINQEETTFDSQFGDNIIFFDNYNIKNNGTFDHEVLHPNLALDYNGDNSFNETMFGMGVLPCTKIYSMGELFTNGAQNVAPVADISPNKSDIITEYPFEASNLDAIVRELCASEQVGMESIVSLDDVNHNQIITEAAMGNEGISGANRW